MTQTPENYLDFACFLHNQFDIKYLTKEEKTAILCWTRSYRFVDKPPMEQELQKFLNTYFNSTSKYKLLKTGLNVEYQKIIEDIYKNKNIGLILYGAYYIDKNSNKDYLLTNYMTQHNKYINLTLNSVSQAILKQIPPEKIDKCCRETPNFEIYYK